MIETTRIKATTKHHSRSMRREMTDAEKLLWQHLRMKQIHGYKFRRQHPLGNYIVDFVCLEAALILEVDGGQHAESADNDAIRTQWIEAKGLHVMRFWNNEVLNNIEGVKLAIWNYLSELQPPHPATRYWRSQPIAGAGVWRPFPPRMLRNAVSWPPSQPSPWCVVVAASAALQPRPTLYGCKGEGVGMVLMDNPE